MNTEVQKSQKQFALKIATQDESVQTPLFYAVATMSISKTLFDNTLHKIRVNIRCELIKVLHLADGILIHEKQRKPIEFEITASSGLHGEMSLRTGQFFIDIEDAKNKGLGTYLFVKIMTEMKQEIDVAKITQTTFHLSAAQATSSDDTMLRNMFYKNLGCTPSNGDWASLKDGLAIFNMNNVRTDWDHEKVQELSVNEIIMSLLDIHRQSLKEATGYKNRLLSFNEYYLPKAKKWDNLVSKLRFSAIAVMSFLILGLLLVFGTKQ